MIRARTRRIVAAALAVGLAAVGADASIGEDTAAAAPIALSAPSSFEPVGPHRFADTRRAECGCRRLDAQTFRVPIGGTALVPEGITAAAVTLTVVGAVGPGFATVYPTGSSRPLASTVNFGPGEAVANSTVVGVGAGGAIDVWVSAPAHVIVDVTGVFAEADRASTGRFVPLSPIRLIDGRDTGAPVGRMAPGSTATIPLPPSVPGDATALAVNVTSVESERRGFLAAYPAGGAAPPTSFLNINIAGAATAGAIIVPTSSDGFSVLNTAGGRLIVDVTGYFTGPSAPTSADGLFVATSVTRLLDTRNERRRLWARGTIEVASPRADAAAVVTNLTLTRTDGPTFVAAHPAGTTRPGVSSINADRRDRTVANAAITPVSTRGMGYYALETTDLIVDVTGYFTGRPVAATGPVPPNERDPRRVLMVGDSTLAAVRNVRASQALFTGFDPVLDAQGCRRLVWPSCWSDSDFRTPNTVEEAILGTPGVVDVVVVMSGYNDWHDPFGSFVDQIMAAARSKGARQVVWLTLSTGRRPETSAEAIGVYAENTRALWAAAPRHPDLVVADWRTYNSRSTGWMQPDGVHLTTRGAFGLADYLSRWIAHLDGRACHAALDPTGWIQDPCPSPNTAWRVPDITGLYGV